MLILYLLRRVDTHGVLLEIASLIVLEKTRFAVESRMACGRKHFDGLPLYCVVYMPACMFSTLLGVLASLASLLPLARGCRAPRACAEVPATGAIPPPRSTISSDAVPPHLLAHIGPDTSASPLGSFAKSSVRTAAVAARISCYSHPPTFPRPKGYQHPHPHPHPHPYQRRPTPTPGIRIRHGLCPAPCWLRAGALFHADPLC